MGSRSDSFDAVSSNAVPAQLRHSWESAEAALFPSVMARPDLYKHAVTAIQMTAAALRQRCPDLDTLVATWDEAETLTDSAVSEAQLPTAELRLHDIAGAAFALRFRELAVQASQQARLTRLAQAREAGAAWALVEETGALEQAPLHLYQRVEVHASTGRALIATVQPDETCSRAVYQLEGGQLDMTTGRLEYGDAPEIPSGEYRDRATWEAAAADIRQRPLTD